MRVAAGAPTSERCIGTVLASRLGESRPALPVWPRRARTRGQPDDRHSHNPSDGNVEVSQPQIEPESQQRRLVPAAGRDHEPKPELEELRAVSGLAHADMLARPVARCLGLQSHEILDRLRRRHRRAAQKQLARRRRTVERPAAECVTRCPDVFPLPVAVSARPGVGRSPLWPLRGHRPFRSLRPVAVLRSASSRMRTREPHTVASHLRATWSPHQRPSCQ
jgi:hypothetical protein